jgi:hypothetical protein
MVDCHAGGIARRRNEGVRPDTLVVVKGDGVTQIKDQIIVENG